MPQKQLPDKFKFDTNRHHVRLKIQLAISKSDISKSGYFQVVPVHVNNSLYFSELIAKIPKNEKTKMLLSKLADLAKSTFYERT